MPEYIIRLDDFADNVDEAPWVRIVQILKKHDIIPIVGVIPNNLDVKLKSPGKFHHVVEFFNSFGLTVEYALHGYDHVYLTKEPGLVPMNPASEFAGLEYQAQKNKIVPGLKALEKFGIIPRIWMAPSHSFDLTTLEVLRNETPIRIITDGIAFKPYNDLGFLWLPQQLWKPKWRPFGVWTICYHPAQMRDRDFDDLEKFLNINHHKVVKDYDALFARYSERHRSFVDLVYERLFFCRRKIERMFL